MTAPSTPSYATLRRLLRSHRVELRIAVAMLEHRGLEDEFEANVEDATGNNSHWLGFCDDMDGLDSAPDPEEALQLEVAGLLAEAADQRAFILAIRTLVGQPQPWGSADQSILFYAPIIRIAEEVLADRFLAFTARVAAEAGISFWFYIETQNLALRPGRRYRWSPARARRVILFYRDMMTVLIDVLADRAPAFYARVEAETGHPFRGDYGVGQ